MEEQLVEKNEWVHVSKFANKDPVDPKSQGPPPRQPMISTTGYPSPSLPTRTLLTPKLGDTHLGNPFSKFANKNPVDPKTRGPPPEQPMIATTGYPSPT